MNTPNDLMDFKYHYNSLLNYFYDQYIGELDSDEYNIHVYKTITLKILLCVIIAVKLI